MASLLRRVSPGYSQNQSNQKKSNRWCRVVDTCIHRSSPLDTRCKDKIVISSKRRGNVVLTWQWLYYYYVMCPLGREPGGKLWQILWPGWRVICVCIPSQRSLFTHQQAGWLRVWHSRMTSRTKYFTFNGVMFRPLQVFLSATVATRWAPAECPMAYRRSGSHSRVLAPRVLR